MINSNTIRVLNQKAFGVDLDRLELFLNAYKFIYKIEDLCYYYPNIKDVMSIFKEVKSDSIVFKNTDEDIEPNNEFDILLDKKQAPFMQIKYSLDSDDTDKLFDGSKEKDIIVWENPEGLNVSCTYINGDLYRVYIISNNTKIMNITEKVRSIIPNHIDNIAQYELVDLRGRLTLTGDIVHENSNVACEIVMMLNNNYNSDKLDCMKIVFNDIIIHNIDYGDTFENQWKLFEFLADTGVNVVNYSLLRGIDTDDLNEAVNQSTDYFIENIKKGEIDYSINTVILDTNDDFNRERVINICRFRTDPCKKFKSKVKYVGMNFDTDDILIEVDIEDTKVNLYDTVNKIILSDILDLENYDIDINSEVKFNMLCGRSVICE